MKDGMKKKHRNLLSSLNKKLIKTNDYHSEEGVDFESIEQRKKIAKLIMNLFDKWAIDTSTQLNLLGLSSKSRALLGPYKAGTKPIPNTRDSLDRIGWLLAIHKALRLLYPHNDELRYHWITYKNKAFDNHCPLELMTEQGMVGLAKVARYLDYRRGR